MTEKLTTGTWELKPIALGDLVHWRLGPLDLWVKHVGEEWHVATTRGDEGRPETCDRAEPPNDVEWRRWAAAVQDPSLKLSPLLPDLPVIVRPGTPLEILPGQEARFFVGVPICVRLALQSGQGMELDICETHTIQLSKSWFGTPIEGELCYALRTRAKRTLGELSTAPHRAVSPILIRNESPSSLNFERLCLRVRDMGVYRGEHHLWTDEGTVAFRGEDSLSHITYGNGPPPFDNAADRLGASRDQPKHGLVHKTFGNLKSFTPF